MRRRALMGVSKGRLPSEYQEVEWIESHGTEWIDTGVIASYELDVRGAIKFELTSLYGADNTTGCIFGSNSTWDTGISLSIAESSSTLQKIRYLNGLRPAEYPDEQMIYMDSAAQTNVIYDAIFSREYSVNGTEYHGGTQLETSGYTNFAIILFGINRGSSVQLYTLINMKCYLFRLQYGDDVIRDFIPCYRKSDNVIGLYDLCGSICPLTGTPFYVNAGSGEFTAGPNVN